MKKLLVLLLIFGMIEGKAQSFSRYIIEFTDKATTPYSLSNPLPYLSQLAVDRRTRYKIAIDSADLPVTPRYLDSLRSAGAVTVLNVSKWLNQVSIQTTDAAALAKIRSFPFVEKAEPIAARMYQAKAKTGMQSAKGRVARARQKKFFQPLSDYFNYGYSYDQIHIHNGEFLHNIGLRGQGMIIGVLDAGFYHYDTSTSLDSLNKNNQVLGTYDFVSRETSVTDDDTHGLLCLHVLAADAPTLFVGSAPKANFYLFRTEESATEYQIEEHNWVCGAERLDSAGGDVISSSLGYANGMSDPAFNHSYSDMNGRTTIAARGAAMAARKGILVINAAGNQGNDATYKYIVTPADVDSVLAVAATNKLGEVAPFSSYGPAADGRVKPDIASVGANTVIAISGEARNGTSYACPNMAGLATCLWQGFREFNNITIMNALRQAGSKAASPDNRVGYGIPDVKKAVLSLLQNFSTATISPSGSCRHTLNWTSKDVSSMVYEIERRGAGETAYKKIGTQQGTGTLFQAQSYQFIDSSLNLSPGTVTYRIRQVIDTAAATFMAGYIDSVSINYSQSCNITGIGPVPALGIEAQLLPNPATDQIQLRLTTAVAIPRLYLRVMDGKGSIVWQQQTAKSSGTAIITIPVQSFATGTYYLSVFAGDKIFAHQKFMKL